MEDPIGNWIWLADLAGTRAALCVGDASDTMANALSRRFEVTWVAEARAVELARLRTRLATAPPGVRLVRAGPDALPLDPESLDCVTLHGLFDWWPERGIRAARAALLADIRRALRPGGCLYVAHANRRLTRGSRPGAMTRALRRAGFRRVRSFYAEPSHLEARYVIPSTRQATLACERALFQEYRQRRLRRSLAALGLHRLLYGSVLHLAEA